MAKTAEQPAAPTKRGKKKWLMIGGVVALLAAAGGGALPFFLPDFPLKKAETSEHADHKEAKPTLIPFGDPVVVNLNTERLSRFLRLRIILVTDGADEKAVQEVMEKNKPFLKTWLIAYLSDQSLKDVTGAAGVNRLRREIRDQFNTMLFPDGSEKINDILFEEFYVQ